MMLTVLSFHSRWQNIMKCKRKPINLPLIPPIHSFRIPTCVCQVILSRIPILVLHICVHDMNSCGQVSPHTNDVFCCAMKVSSPRKDKFIVGEHTLHFPTPRSLSHRGVYPFPFGPAPPRSLHSRKPRLVSRSWVRQHFAIIFEIRMSTLLLPQWAPPSHKTDLMEICILL